MHYILYSYMLYMEWTPIYVIYLTFEIIPNTCRHCRLIIIKLLLYYLCILFIRRIFCTLFLCCGYMFNHYIQIGVIIICERQLFSKTENTHIRKTKMQNYLQNVQYYIYYFKSILFKKFFTLYYKDRNTFYNMVGTFVR